METKFISTSVYAVKIWKKYVLSGVGSRLCIYGIQDQEQSMGYSLKKYFSSIKGIMDGRNGNEIIIWGGKRMIAFNLVEKVVVWSVQTKDWILAAHCLDNEFVVMYAHNIIEFFDYSGKEKGEKIRGTQNCLLYSVRMWGRSRDELLIASGTIYNSVIVWKDGKELLHLSGHDGVIFGINFSRDGSALCSVSDDRTVRYWKWNDEYLVQKSFVCYGHYARVWNVAILDNYIVSCSEDAAVRFWNYEGVCVHILEGHYKKSVWTFDISSDEQLLVTGGGDGSVKFWSMEAIREQITGSNLTKFRMNNENIRCCCVVNDEAYFGTSEKVYHISSKKKLELLFHLNKEKFGSPRSICCHESVLYIGTTCGWIVLYSMEKRTISDQLFVKRMNIVELLVTNDHIFVPLPTKELYSFRKGKDGYHIRQIFRGKSEITCLEYLPEFDLVLSGCKNGSIYVFDHEQTSPICFSYHTEMQDRVTCVKRIDKDIVFMSVLSSLCTMLIEKRNGVYSIRPLMLYRNSIVPQIRNVWVHDGDIVVSGYFSSFNLVLYNLTKSCRLFSFDCGKRILDISYQPNHQYAVCHCKKEEVSFIVGSKKNFATESQGTAIHGRDIQCVASYGNFLITGSEDGIVNIIENEKVVLRMTCFHASLRDMSIVELTEDEILLFTVGSREEYTVTRIPMKNLNRVNMEFIEFMSDRYHHLFTKVDNDITFRATCVESVLLENGIVAVFIGGSDSVLKFYLYRDGFFFPVAKSNAHTGLIKDLKICRMESSIYLFSSCTGSKFLCHNVSKLMEKDWESLSTSELCQHFKIPELNYKPIPWRELKQIPLVHSFKHSHQSGINCISVSKGEKGVRILCGGDDQSISLHCIPLSNGELDFTKHDFLKRENVHSSGVTDVFLRDDLSLSVSPDQRLNVYDNKLMFQEGFLSDIPDISCVDVMENGDILIGGFGLEKVARKGNQNVF